MTKYLLLFLLALVVWWAWKKRRPADPGGGDRNAAAPAPERMVRCAHCGVHLPESDAVSDGQRHFCNEAHRRAGRSGGA